MGLGQEEYVRPRRRSGNPVPQTFNPRTEEELSAFYSRLPLAIKPAVKENFFYATGAKAWRAETPDQLTICSGKRVNRSGRKRFWFRKLFRGMVNGNIRTAHSFATAKRTVR